MLLRRSGRSPLGDQPTHGLSRLPDPTTGSSERLVMEKDRRLSQDSRFATRRPKADYGSETYYPSARTRVRTRRSA